MRSIFRQGLEGTSPSGRLPPQIKTDRGPGKRQDRGQNHVMLILNRE
jgi:hypothetical protein